MSGLRASLRVAEFRALLISYAINRAGDVVGSLALAVVVLSVTGSALATALLFLATQFLPGLVGPAIVVRIDRIAPGRILPSLYAVECCLFLVLAAIVHRVGAAPLIAIAFLDALIAFAARTITRSATGSTLAPHDLIPEGKAAFNVALAAAMIGGPVIAGVVLELRRPGRGARDRRPVVPARRRVGAAGPRAPGGPGRTRRRACARPTARGPALHLAPPGAADVDLRRGDRVRVLLSGRTGHGRLRDRVAARRRGWLRRDPCRVGRGDRARLGRAGPPRPRRLLVDDHDLDRRRRGRLHRHRGGADARRGDASRA